MQGILKTLEPIVDTISKDFETCQPVVMISNKLNVKPGHVVGGFFLAGLLLVITGIASNFITALMGFAYPAYMSFKALESEGDEDDMQWLTYWVVFIFVNFFDNVVGIFFSIIPLYHLLKLIFYVYLYYPKSKGALTVYKNFVRPILKKYESQIDEALKKGENLKEKIEKNLQHTKTD